MIMYTKTALITGASSGIGMATAKIFARNGINLILCGRRQERLNALKNELNSLCNIHILNFKMKIILVGYMGSGKSAIGKQLATSLSFKFFINLSVS